MNHRTARRYALLTSAMLAVSIAAPGCKSLRRGGDSATRPIVVEVVNHGFPDVVLYVSISGTSLRLGMVNGNSSGKFTLNQSMLPGGFGSLQLVARPIAGRAYLLPIVQVSPGDLVSVTLDATQAQAQVTVSSPEP